MVILINLGILVSSIILAPVISIILARLGIFQTAVNVMHTVALIWFLVSLLSFDLAGIIASILLYAYAFFVWRAQRSL